MLLVKILIGLFSLSLLILIHEWGHFIAARIFGVHVQTFSIGFGKKLIVKKWKSTEYAISLIPLGGYCRFKGEQNFIQAYEKKLDHIPDEKGALFSVSPLKRIIIALAGPIMNGLAAFLLLFSIAWIDSEQEVLPPQIVLASQYFSDELWPADTAGLKTGDLIHRINDEIITSYQDIEKIVMLSPDKSLIFSVERSGNYIDLVVIPTLDKQSGIGKVGIYPYISNRIISDFYIDDSQIIPSGSSIISFQDKPITLLTDIFPLLTDNSSEYLIKVIHPSGSTMEYVTQNKELFVNNIPLPYRIEISEVKGFLNGLTNSINEFTSLVQLSFHSISLLFKGIDPVNTLMGPLRAPLITGEVTLIGFGRGFFQGIKTIFSFLASLSLALAIVNLLPIPALDGGQILLFFFHLFRRKPLRPDFIFHYQLVGSMIVLVIMFFSVSMDLLYFFRR